MHMKSAKRVWCLEHRTCPSTIRESKSVSHSCAQLIATPWTVALQAPLSMEHSRQEYWSGFLFQQPNHSLVFPPLTPVPVSTPRNRFKSCSSPSQKSFKPAPPPRHSTVRSSWYAILESARMGKAPHKIKFFSILSWVVHRFSFKT